MRARPGTQTAAARCETGRRRPGISARDCEYLPSAGHAFEFMGPAAFQPDRGAGHQVADVLLAPRQRLPRCPTVRLAWPGVCGAWLVRCVRVAGAGRGDVVPLAVW